MRSPLPRTDWGSALATYLMWVKIRYMQARGYTKAGFHNAPTKHHKNMITRAHLLDLICSVRTPGTDRTGGALAQTALHSLSPLCSAENDTPPFLNVLKTKRTDRTSYRTERRRSEGKKEWGKARDNGHGPAY